jgi:hypothetical protein
MPFVFGDAKKQSARTVNNHAGGFGEKLLALLLFAGSGGGLRGLGFGHALLEFVDAAGGINEFLLSGVERMAGVADTNNNHRFGRPGLNHVAASATYFRIHVLWMNVLFHKRPHTIPFMPRMTSPDRANCKAQRAQSHISLKSATLYVLWAAFTRSVWSAAACRSFLKWKGSRNESWPS